MKILMVSVAFKPSYAFGGAPKVAYDLAKELAKRNHNVVIYTSDAKDAHSRLGIPTVGVVDDVEAHYFKNISLLPIRLSKLFITPNLIPVVRENLKEFDIIHLHEYRSFQNVVIHHYARKYDLPYLLQAHGSIPSKTKKKTIKLLFDGAFGYNLLNNASKLIALSKTESQQYQQMGATKRKIEVLPNGIDFSYYDFLPIKGTFKNKYGLAADKKLVLFLGRIHWEKGVDQLVKAYAYLVNELKFSNSILAIVGPDDNYLSEVQGLINSLGLQKNILLTGPLYGHEKLSAYNDADVCVLPSRYEAFPMSALEAFACGKPIVASNIPGLRDLVVRVGGTLFEPENTQQLAQCLFETLNNPEEAIKKGLEGREFVKKNFSIQSVVDRLERIYREIIDN